MRRRWIVAVIGVAVAATAFAVAGGATFLGEDDASVSSGPFIKSDAKRSAQVWAVGDGANGKPVSRRLARQIARSRPDRFLYLGDVYETGTDDEFRRNYAPLYGAMNGLTAPTPGNHEWGNREEGYDAYWRAARGQVRPYYSFKTAGWEVLSLNSQIDVDEDSAQMRWLRRALRERGTCRIAFMHRSYLSAGRHGDQEDLVRLWEALRGRAAIVLGAHDHNMQRFKRRNGLVQFVSGAGGDGLYESNENDPRLAWDEDDEYGALHLNVRPGLARFRFVQLGGRVLHSGRVRCDPLST